MIIQSTRVWIEEQWVAAQIDIEKNKIRRIYPHNTKNVDKDYGDLRIYPGFIDTHCHGAMGFDTNEADEEGLKQWLSVAVMEGVTSLCPTTITQGEEVLTKALKNVVNVMKQEPFGAQIVGIHFEGPYLCSKYKGAQPEEFIVKPNLEQFKRYEAASNGLIKIMTMAVENDEDYELVDYASRNGVAINIGHSAASYSESIFAIANGASGFTHTFNGMGPFNHREPGTVGAALRIGSAYAELICDGIHVSWPAVNVLFNAKGKDHIVMVTDALQAKGVGEGRYVFGGQAIDIRSNGGAYLADTDRLAGSTLGYNQSLKNVIELASVNEVSAINSGTINPAKVLKIDHKKGRIRANYDADLVILDRDYDVVETYVLGQAVYTR
jgi:N-acetylglucosamine-6-phosphate deacetylase